MVMAMFARVREILEDGDAFVCVDNNGEEPQHAMVASIDNGSGEETAVTCLDEARHGLEDGGVVVGGKLRLSLRARRVIGEHVGGDEHGGYVLAKQPFRPAHRWLGRLEGGEYG